jgi:hypothetical protein
MGCQCAKSTEKSNMNLETAPPKLEQSQQLQVNEVTK